MSMDLYRELILEHYQHPRNMGDLKDADIHHHDKNPLCGDQVGIGVKLDKNKVVDIKFRGQGCAISQASTSILTEKAKGMTVEQLKALTKDDIQEWLGVPLSSTRLKCALLPLTVLQAGIYKKEEENPS